MTKDAEIALLDSVIKAFGVHSYIGPWLAHNRERIVSNIRNDFPPGLWVTLGEDVSIAYKGADQREGKG